MSLRSSQKINESQSSTTPRLILDRKVMISMRQLSTGALLKQCADDTESEDNTHQYSLRKRESKAATKAELASVKSTPINKSTSSKSKRSTTRRSKKSEKEPLRRRKEYAEKERLWEIFKERNGEDPDKQMRIKLA